MLPKDDDNLWYETLKRFLFAEIECYTILLRYFIYTFALPESESVTFAFRQSVAKR